MLMDSARIPWQVWPVLALAGIVWWLIQLPGEPHLSDTTSAAGLTILAAVLLVLGSTLGWMVFALFSTGCVVLAVSLALFGAPSGVSALGLVELGAAGATQLRLLFSAPMMRWAVDHSPDAAGSHG
jgi:hypothetical protein